MTPHVSANPPLLKPPPRATLTLMGETLIDAQFQKSPLPVLRAARQLRAMAPGEKLRVLATDPAAIADFREFCAASGHALIATGAHAGVYSFSLKRKP
jgi:tRNA 2-thiouridine synthesizing protein A